MSRIKKLIILIVCVLLVGIFDVFVIGDTFIHEFPIILEGSGVPEVEIENEDVLEVYEAMSTPETARVVFKGKNPGTTEVHITVRGDGGKYLTHSGVYCVHRNGLITQGGYLGTTNRFYIIGIEAALCFVIAFILRVRKCMKLAKKNMYSYSLAGHIGVALFLLACSVLFIAVSIRQGTANYRIDIMYMAFFNIFELFAMVAFPIVFIVSIYLCVSNVVLIRKEGFSFTNCLCILLGFGLILMTFLGYYTERILYMDPYSYKNLFKLRLVSHIVMFFYSLLCYFECILVSTFYCAERAGRYVPRRNKDYIIVLGCGLKKDGTLTPLLAGRADRAIWFSKKQKDETGRDIIFIPSGGKGDDEVIAEGEAIRNYLIEKGIKPDHILVENKSTSTYENLKYSFDIIKNREREAFEGDGHVGIAYSTTDYHVLRSGVIAKEQGVKATGLGSRTKWYFHINAIIREFIAILKAERRTHIRNVILLMIYTLVLFFIATKIGYL